MGNMLISIKITLRILKTFRTRIKNTIMAWVEVTKSNNIKRNVIFLREIAVGGEMSIF